MFLKKKISHNYENRYQLLIKNLLDFICELDLKGTFTYVNPFIYDVLGYKPKEIIGKSIIEFSHPDDQQLVKLIFKDIIKNQNYMFHNFRISHKKGHFLDVSFSGRVVHIRRCSKIIVVIKDLTPYKKIEQKLKQLEEKYKSLVETSSMALLEIDVKNGGIVYINPKLLKILGYTQEDVINRGMFYKAIFSKDCNRLQKFDEEKKVQFRLLNKEGKIKWLSGRILHHTDEQGELLFSRLWLQDITEMKELEEIKSNLLTRISHEIKTPLISIKGFTELLLTNYDSIPNSHVLSFLKRIKDGSERLKLIINRFLETTQLEKSLIRLNFTYENLSTLIKKEVNDLEGLINLRNQLITIDIADELNSYVDKEKIQSVISNLLTNAIKYTPTEGKINIKSKIKKKTIEVSISDNGIGLEKKEIKRLFMPFGKIERYGKGWDIIADGIGLGLYLSKEIIKLHNGEIWVESQGLQKGSTFYFSIPLIKRNSVL